MYGFCLICGEEGISRERSNNMYGFCPICGEEGISRERRINGNDTCKNGHKYPSKDSLNSKDQYLNNIICPVCGYNCLGSGGNGCIDKPGFMKNKKD